MSDKKYTISLTLDELLHLQEALSVRQEHYYYDYVEFAEDKEHEEKQEKIVKKLYSRIVKKVQKIMT